MSRTFNRITATAAAISVPGIEAFAGLLARPWQPPAVGDGQREGLEVHEGRAYDLGCPA